MPRRKGQIRLDRFGGGGADAGNLLQIGETLKWGLIWMAGFELLAEPDDGGGALFAEFGYGGKLGFGGDVRIDPVGQLAGCRGLCRGRFIDGCGIERQPKGQDHDEDSQHHHPAAALGGRGEQGLGSL